MAYHSPCPLIKYIGSSSVPDRDKERSGARGVCVFQRQRRGEGALIFTKHGQ